MLGRTIGDYALEAEVGSGGQGTVYRARHRQLERQVALKVLHDLDPEARARFLREGQLLARLEDPGLPQVHELGTASWGAPFLALEWVAGFQLRDRLRARGRPDPRQAAQLIAALARTLETCHQAGVIHRDLKPQNVIVRQDDERPVLVDFGLAKPDPGGDLTRSLDLASLTQTGAIVGTPAYLAPEQVDPSWGRVGPWTDVYGLGGLLYFLLTEEPPFGGEGLLATMFNVVHERRPDPRQAAPETPQALASLVARCLRREPEQRPPSAADVARALDDYLAGKGPEYAALGRGPAGLLLGATALVAVALSSWLARPISQASPLPSPASLVRGTPAPAPQAAPSLDVDVGPIDYAAWLEREPASLGRALEAEPRLRSPEVFDALGIDPGAADEVQGWRLRQLAVRAGQVAPEGARGVVLRAQVAQHRGEPYEVVARFLDEARALGETGPALDLLQLELALGRQEFSELDRLLEALRQAEAPGVELEIAESELQERSKAGVAAILWGHMARRNGGEGDHGRYALAKETLWKLRPEVNRSAEASQWTWDQAHELAAAAETPHSAAVALILASQAFARAVPSWKTAERAGALEELASEVWGKFGLWDARVAEVRQRLVLMPGSAEAWAEDEPIERMDAVLRVSRSGPAWAEQLVYWLQVTSKLQRQGEDERAAAVIDRCRALVSGSRGFMNHDQRYALKGWLYLLRREFELARETLGACDWSSYRRQITREAQRQLGSEAGQRFLSGATR